MPNAGKPCDACRLSLADACATGVPPQLCGLCKLMPPEQVERYLAIWRPPPLPSKKPPSEEDPS